MTSLLTETWTDVCSIDDLVPGRGVAALVDGEAVAVFALADGRVFALSNHDPWSAANVMARGIVGSLADRLVVASPMHKHHVDLTTGEGVEHPDVHLPIFAARVVHGRVEIGPRL